MWPHTACASTQYGPVLLYCSESKALSTSPCLWLYFHLVIFQSNLGGHPKYLTSWCTSAVLHIHNLCRKINVSFVTTYADFEREGKRRREGGGALRFCGLLFSSLYWIQSASFCLCLFLFCVDHFLVCLTNNMFGVTDLFGKIVYVCGLLAFLALSTYHPIWWNAPSSDSCSGPAQRPTQANTGSLFLQVNPVITAWRLTIVIFFFQFGGEPVAQEKQTAEAGVRHKTAGIFRHIVA